MEALEKMFRKLVRKGKRRKALRVLLASGSGMSGEPPSSQGFGGLLDSIDQIQSLSFRDRHVKLLSAAIEVGMQPDDPLLTRAMYHSCVAYSVAAVALP